ncbi:hypothetical protein Pcinc_024750 [Petrolisthes cinctipes]|uniref:Protein AATF n=1 Tax=Petrolisthes cinctipes TaxID=88211 RepID=A0AAE1F9A3_PETCI|nr:hypothetical protein Pcinc_024750 [Petrolisthes cinctipes]
MAAELKSYVEKYLLNPGASFAVDEEGNQNAKPEVVEALADGERADETPAGVSKLRARSAALLQEKDPRYRGKKVSRHDLNKDKQVEFDPELTKYFLVEGDGGEEEGEESDENVDSEDEEEIDENIDREDEEGEEEGENVNNVIKMDDEEEDTDENVDYENSDDDENDVQEEAASGSGVRFVDDGDFSKFADDFDNEDEESEQQDDDEDEESEQDDDDDEESESEQDNDDDDNDEDMDDSTENQTIKRFHSDDHHDQLKKGQAVRHQLAIYDSLFEGRIGLQKVMSASNQIPQYDTYKPFLAQKDPNYTRNIIAAKSATRLLLTTLIHLQELLLKQNPETNHIITGKKSKYGSTESDEEITSSEDEDQDQEMEQSSSEARGVKRKMKLEECEEVLSKRHTAIIPFRDFTINKWYEKTKLLSSHSGGNKFSGFETSALQQLNNILANKPQLVRRTQLTGSTRGTTYQVLGRLTQHQEQQQQQPKTDEYDPEIFDDTDFYSRCLEEVLKSKVALSDNMTDVSRKWIEIQNLRRKTKRNVDKKASKGRKLRYEVMSKLQQYLAPSYFSLMDDAAINTLFASLFGKSTQKTLTTA